MAYTNLIIKRITLAESGTSHTKSDHFGKLKIKITMISCIWCTLAYHWRTHFASSALVHHMQLLIITSRNERTESNWRNSRKAVISWVNLIFRKVRVKDICNEPQRLSGLQFWFRARGGNAMPSTRVISPRIHTTTSTILFSKTLLQHRTWLGQATNGIPRGPFSIWMFAHFLISHCVWSVCVLSVCRPGFKT